MGSQTAEVAAVDPTSSRGEPTLRYPRGPWWRGDMSRLYVTAAHILVTHDGVSAQNPLPGAASSTRSREEALTKALGLQAQLERDPARFEALAARESDDKATAPLGGALGTFLAAHVPPEIVDALGHLRPGDISHVVESSAGFHLLRRLEAPPSDAYSFAHIVIKHDEAVGWKRLDREVPKRSRADALALALRVADEAKREPARFAELVQQYSEADDVLRDGDVGALSAYDEIGADRTFFTRASRLAPAQVSEVFDGPSGWEIVQRTPKQARELRAASLITLPYQGAQSNVAMPATRSKEKTQKIAAALLRELRAKPALFAQRRAEYCELYHCREAFHFRRGRELSALDVAVGKLRVGELAVVDSPVGLLVVRREDPATVAGDTEPARVTEFPTEPAEEEAQAAAEPAADAPMSPADLVADFATRALRELKLKGKKASSFSAIYAELVARIQARADGDFGEDSAWADAQVLALLGEDKNEEFLRLRRRYAAQRQ